MSASTYETDAGYGDDPNSRAEHDDRDLDEYGDEPPRGNARRRRLALIVVVVFVVAVAATWVVAFSSLFGVRSIDVRGNHALTSAQVARAADIRNGTPLVRVDVAAATRRVEGLPEIRSAQISTSFPSSVVITVTERTPVGYVRVGGGASLVDRTGLRYRTVATAPAGLPRFTLPAGSASRATGVALARVAAAMPAALRREVDSIEALDPTAITVVLTHGRVVRWGSAARSAAKARILPVLLKAGDQHIDVTDPDRPFSH